MELLTSLSIPLFTLVVAVIIRLPVRKKYPRTPFADPRDVKNADQIHAKVIREMITHENDVINHRLSWLLAVEGFLFAGLAFAWKLEAPLVTVIAFTGSAIALFTLPVLTGAHAAIDQMAKWWEDNREEVQKKEPDVIGFRQNLFPLKVLPTWYTLPVIFMLAWSAIIYLNLTRAPNKWVDANRENVENKVIYPDSEASSDDDAAPPVPDGSP